MRLVAPKSVLILLGATKPHLNDLNFSAAKLPPFFLQMSLGATLSRFTEEPYILAIQAKQVFYIKDLVLGGNWEIVQECNHRGIWDVPEVDPTTSASIMLTIELSNIDRLNHRHEIVETELVTDVDDIKKAMMMKMRRASFLMEKMSMSI